MSHVAATGAATAGAAAAAIAQAVKASGVLVRIEPGDFEELVVRGADLLVIHQGPGGFFQRKHRYLTHYRGFAFHAESDLPLSFPAGTEILSCAQIWIPG
jgi:hypothetical protein